MTNNEPYPIPHLLSSKINKILDDLDLLEETKAELFNRIVKLYVRENRLIRMHILQLARELVEYAQTEEEDFGSSVASYAGEETAKHICEEIVKSRVYVNTQEREKRLNCVEDVIKEFNKCINKPDDEE